MKAQPSLEVQRDVAPTILIVEDEVLIRFDLAERLRGEGYVVIEASDGDEALAIMGLVSAVALIVSDVRMPGKIDGVMLAALIKQQTPHIKVMLVSGHLSKSAMDAVADVSLSKPVNPLILLEHVKKLVGEPVKR